MSDFTPTPSQLILLQQPLDGYYFVEGPAGAGKTTAGVQWMIALLKAGIPGNSILLLLPQRTLARSYNSTLRDPAIPSGGSVVVLTVGGLAHRMVDLFWPIVSVRAGFEEPRRLPTFLTQETAQYFMAHLVQPLIDEKGLFDSVTIDRNRLFSQIIDNLNKAAVMGFPHTEIGERLKGAWIGEPGQLRVYDDVQNCAIKFRQFCLEHNLLDFSLQMEVFYKYLWSEPFCRNYLRNTYRYLIYDNLEEDTPVAHSLMRQLLPEFKSTLLIYDWEAGYRRFLGADPDGAYEIRTLCQKQIVFEHSLVMSSDINALSVSLIDALNKPAAASAKTELAPLSALEYCYHRFYPQMLDWVVEQIADLVLKQGVPPGQIVVLAPFLSDALRFLLANRLEAQKIPAHSHRPSRALRDEPTTHCLLTLAALKNPQWALRLSKFDVAYALMQAIEGLDLVRAQLLTEIVYRQRDGMVTLSSFDQIKSDMQERITYRLGARYETLRLWLEAAQGEVDEFDHFLSRLFGEVLSQPGFGFHTSYDAGDVTANLIESVQKFRWSAGQMLELTGVPLGREYLAMVQGGVIAAQYLSSWYEQPEDAVLLAPAYTFLMSNRAVEVQFWLDVGSRGWSERLYQPLTHPYVLSHTWEVGRPWTDADEVSITKVSLYRLVQGLLRRCRSRVFLGLSELGEQGFEQRGPLLMALQRVLRNQAGEVDR